MPTVNYLRVIDCEHDAVNINESYRKDHWNDKRKFMKAYQYTNAWCNRVVAKQEASHSAASADKQVNEKNYNQSTLFLPVSFILHASVWI